MMSLQMPINSLSSGHQTLIVILDDRQSSTLGITFTAKKEMHQNNPLSNNLDNHDPKKR